MQYILLIAEAKIKNCIHTRMRYLIFPDKIPLLITNNGDINLLFKEMLQLYKYRINEYVAYFVTLDILFVSYNTYVYRYKENLLIPLVGDRADV